MPLVAGSRLGPYEVLEFLGAGGMGEVYKARDGRLGRDVAIKVLPESLSGNADRLQRFEREARAAGSLNHPNVLTVFDIGFEEARPYVVCELLQGETLRDLIIHQPIPARRAIGLALEIARGLACAHDAGVLHRDLKPENVFLTREGRVKILDFGLAKLIQPEGGALPEGRTVTADTGARGPVGTVAYMSPEQVRDEPLDGRSDLFALGAILYELLSRRRAFDGATDSDVMAAILRDEPSPLATVVAVPPAVDTLLQKCLEKRREDRYRSAQQLEGALEALVASLGADRGAVAAEEQGPYPGLRSFTEADAPLFFGRESEVEALWSKLRTRHLLAVVGASGAGKTSFLRAGVVPARPKGWGAVVCTPGNAPLLRLGEVLAPELAGDPEALRNLVRFDDDETAFAVVSRWRRRMAGALVVVDQLEELFTLNPPTGQERFARLLGRLAGESDVHVLVAIRDDFLLRCHEHDALAPVFVELTPLRPPGRDALHRALVEPASRRGFTYEDDQLVQEMISAVAGGRGALPLLAFAAARLWAARDREKRVLTRAAYQETGGVAGSLAQHAEATIERIGVERQPIVRDVFRDLVTADGTRSVRDREELLSAFPDRVAAGEVLQQLIEARLLTSYETPGTPDGAPRHRIEIVHESLLKAWPRLVRWQAQDADGAVLRDQLRQAAGLWAERGRPSDLLWTGDSYREFDLWRQRYSGGLSAAEQEFANAMERQFARRRTRRRLALGGLIGLLAAVLAVVMTLWLRAERARRAALSEAAHAEASRLVALGRAELDRDPTATLAYARKSLETADTPAARLLAVAALWRGPMARVMTLPEGRRAHRTSFSPDGRSLAVFPLAKQVLVYRDDGGAPKVLEAHRILGDGPAGFTADSASLYMGEELGWPGGDTGVRVVSAVDGREKGWVRPRLPEGAKLNGFDRLDEGLLFSVSRGSGDKMLTTFELWPFAATTPRVLGSLSGQLPLQVGGRIPQVAVLRRDGIRIRPLAGPATTPERRVGEFGDETKASAILISPRGDLMAVAEWTGRLALWPLRIGAQRPLRVFEVGDVGAARPTFDGSGSRIAWSAGIGGTWVWPVDGPPDAAPFEWRIRDPSGARSLIGQGAAEFHPNGRWLAVPKGNVVRLWPAARPQARAFRHRGVTKLVFTPDSRWLVTGGGLDPVTSWPLAAAAGRAAKIPHEGELCFALAVSPDGRWIARGGQMGVYVFERASGRGRWLLRNWGPDNSPQRGPSYGLAFDAAGRRLVSAPAGYRGPDAKKLLRVWDLATGQVREVALIPEAEWGKRVDNFDWGLNSVAFTATGQVIGAGDRGIRLFDLERGTSEWIWEVGPTMRVGMVVSAHAKTILAKSSVKASTAAPGGALMMLDVGTGTRREITSHGSRVGPAAIDGARRIVVTGDAEGTVRVGSVEGGEPHLLLGHDGPVSALAISDDGRWIASAAGSEVLLWPMPDLGQPPLHLARLPALLAKLRELTNVEVVKDDTSAGGYRIEIGAFPGWRSVPEW
jgi:WD40 repeat protein